MKKKKKVDDEDLEVPKPSELSSSGKTDKELLDYLLKFAPDDARIPILQKRV